MKTEYYKRILAIVFYVWLLTLYILTALPGSNGPEKFSDSTIRWDYLEHFFLFMAVSGLYMFSGGAGIKARSLTVNLLILLAGILYAVSAEVQQIAIPGRAFNPVDLMLNLSGLLVGIPVGWILERTFFGRRKIE